MNEKLIVVMYDLITICGLFILILISISDNGGYVSSYEIDEVTSLPGWNRKLSSRHFSGFLDGGSVDGDDEKSMKLHYWLVESETNPETKPLIFWFNGGPGASSLYGMLIELGPYVLSDISLSGPEYEQTKIPQLIYNPHGWQKIANIVAISMPPPIGYSYCNDNVEATGDDCTPAIGYWNDTSTAQVTFNGILSFFKKFPHFQKHEIFLSGESYAGVYIPMIVRNILASIDTHPINLKGFAVGDACAPPNICGKKQMGPFYNIEFLFGKNAFSNRLYDSIKKTCTTEELKNGSLSTDCSTEVSKIMDEVGQYWIYAYYDDCWYENDIRRRLASITKTNSNKEFKYHGPPVRALSDSLVDRVVDLPSNGYYCGGPSVQVMWLGLAEVKKALNVPENAKFFQCDNGEGFTYWSDIGLDLVSWYKDIVAENKLRILVYNGDTDPAISAYESQEWTQSLNYSQVQSWRPWTQDSCQSIGGYVIRYQNSFDFLTIKGSGHMVPQFRPSAALEFMSRFINNEDYQYYDPTCKAPPSSSLDSISETEIEYMLAKEKLEWSLKEKVLLNKLKKLKENN